MDFNSYQEEAVRTASFLDSLVNQEGKILATKHELIWLIELMYCSLGLAGECGEILEKVKKCIRDKGGKVSEEDREAIEAEAGDCFWYLSVLTDILGIKGNDIAKSNLRKLQSRAQRGKISGSGDKR